MSFDQNTQFAESVAEQLEEAGYEVADVDVINQSAKVRMVGKCANVNQCCDDEMCYCSRWQVVNYQPILKSINYAKVHQLA